MRKSRFTVEQIAMALRQGVVWAREAYRLPERRACRAMGIPRSGTVRYKSVKPPREPLRARLRE